MKKLQSINSINFDCVKRRIRVQYRRKSSYTTQKGSQVSKLPKYERNAKSYNIHHCSYIV